MTDYEYYKAHHICVICHSEEATQGSTCCPTCLANRRERERGYAAKKRQSAEYRERQKEYYHNRRKKLKDAGICVKCGRRKTRPGKTTCKMCAVKEVEKQRERLNQKPFWLRAELGICYKCDKPAVEGYRLCEEHLALARQFITKAVTGRLGREE